MTVTLHAAPSLPCVVDHAGDEACPAALVAGSEPPSRVAVEKLVEPEVVFPVFIKVQAVVAGVDASSPIVGPNKEVLEAVLDFLCHLTEMHVVAAFRRTLDLEFWTVEEKKALYRFD